MSAFGSLKKLALRLLLGVTLSVPLLGADCGLTGSDGAEYDGTYNLVAVNGVSLGSGYDMYRPGGTVDPKNRLILYRGEWTVSSNGTYLTTRMWTKQIINGATQSTPQYQPETHYADISIDDGTASGTLDSGTYIYATISGERIVQDGTNTLKFCKAPSTSC